MSSKRQLVTSAVAFALACLVMVTVHELGHVLAALIQGNRPILYGFSVDDRSTTDSQKMVTAAAGPLLSLITGAAILAVPTRRWPRFWALTTLWLGLLSVQEFSGYLVTGPFAHIGDVGAILEVSKAPAVVGWLGFLAGWAVTYLLGRHAVRRLCQFAAPEPPLAPQLRALGLFAWLLGALLVILLSLGLLTAGGVNAAVVAFEALGVLSSGIFLVFVRFFLRHGQPPVTGTSTPWATPWSGIATLVALAVVRQIALSHGLTL